MEDFFNEDDLYELNWQYSIIHNKVDMFNISESVFLKSNPEHEMYVQKINDNKVTVYWIDANGITKMHDFPPQCILQYKYAGLKTFKRKFNICFN